MGRAVTIYSNTSVLSLQHCLNYCLIDKMNLLLDELGLDKIGLDEMGTYRYNKAQQAQERSLPSLF